MTATQISLTEKQIAGLREIGEDVRACERDLNAGKEPCISHQPCGREIRLVAGGFATQPAGDNYWIAVPTLDDAIEAYENPSKFR